MERKRLEELVEEEDVENDDDVGLLGDEEAYKKYLKQKMKKMQSKTYVFAFALSKPSTPEGHRFLFHKSKDGKKLGMQILDEVPGLETKKLTWGMAGADPQVSTTLVLMLEHKQLPGMIKQGNKFLKAFKPLPFDTIKLVSAETGQELQDLPDPEDAETGAPATATATPSSTAAEPSTEPSTPSPSQKSDLLARLNALTPRIKEFAANADLAGLKAGADLEAKKAALAPKNRLLTLIRDCKGMIGTNDEQAEAMLVDIESILDEGQANAAPSSADAATKFNERLKALVPLIKAAAGTPIGDDAKLKASESGVFARKKEFVEANSLLDAVEKLLAGRTATQVPSQPRQVLNAGTAKVNPGVVTAVLSTTPRHVWHGSMLGSK